MRMYCDIITKKKHDVPPCFDEFVINHPSIGEVRVDFDECDMATDDGIRHSYRFKGIRFTTEDNITTYANSKMNIVRDSKLTDVIVADVDEVPLVPGVDFTFSEGTILFSDFDEEFELEAKY